MSWQTDKKWSDKFLPDIKRILGEHLISEPPIAEDAERNTDLMVLKLDAVRIGCRIRKFNYFDKYGHQFTIRAGRPRGTKTELQKIIEGWGNYFFYGFSDQTEKGLHAWYLADLNQFRLWYCRQLARMDKGNTPGLGRNNVDGSSNFLAFNWDDFPADFLVASSQLADIKAAS